MALILPNYYPGRFNAPTAAYPHGSHKNRTTSTSNDGSYYEQAWANDIQGFHSQLLSAAGITPSGVPDQVGASDLYNALKGLFSMRGNNLSDVANAATSLSNLGGLAKSKNLSDLASIPTALTNLGLVDANGFGGQLTGKPQIITSTGTYTPTPGCKFAIVELVGGGGGGGGCWQADAAGASAGGGGGSGGYSLFFFKNPVATAVTIGLGGAQGPVSLNSSPNDGTPGGDTLFGSLAIARGGYGGLSTAWAVRIGTSDTACTDGGGGAPAGTGDIALPGNAGQRGQQLSLNGSAGNGAPSKLGSGAFRARGYSGVLYQPTFGGGGLGNYRVSNATTPGTNGADGLCIVWEFF